MEIKDQWVPLLLQSVNDAMKYKQMLLQSETLRDTEEHEESLLHLGELLGYLREEYSKHQDHFKFTPEQILNEQAPFNSGPVE